MTFALLTLSIALYWAKAPLFFAPVPLLVLLAVSLSRSVDAEKMKLFFIFSALLVVNSLYSFAFVEASGVQTILHLFVLSFLAVLSKVELSGRAINQTISVYLIFSTVLLVVSLLDSAVFNYAFFVKTSGLARFEGVFKEPSYNAIFASWLLYILLFYGKAAGGKTYLAMVAGLLFFCAISLSGSGLILSAVAVGAYFVYRQFNVVKVAILGLFLAVAVVFFVPQSAFEFVLGRGEGILVGDFDASTYLRFVGPLYAAAEVLREYPLMGVGISNVDPYIQQNYTDFYFLTKVDSDGESYVNTNIDNGHVYWLLASGVVGFAVLLGLIIYVCLQDKVARPLLLFSSFVLFFTGSIINPIFMYPLFCRVVKEESVEKIR